MSGRIVLIRLGEPVIPVRAQVGDYSLWFQRALPEPLGVVDLRNLDEELPDDAAAFIFMGSPTSVFDPHPWLPRALSVANQLLDGDRPTLGVCFGHQLFAVARGGEVRRNERGVEVGTVDVTLTPEANDDPLFKGFGGRLRVNASHDDTIVRAPEPSPTLLGTSALEGSQVLRWGECHWSVQFHPEMRQAETRLAAQWRAPRLREEGRDPAEVVAQIEEAPDGLAVLRNFLAYVRTR